MSLYESTAPVFVRGLNIGITYLDKAAADAEARKFEPEVLIHSRLAPDMMNFGRQVELMSDAAKSTIARCADIEIPSFPDANVTLPELKRRLVRTIEFIQGIEPDQINGAKERYVEIKNRLFTGKMTKVNFVLNLAIPNFYFHLTTMHDILRHNGVRIDKADYIGDLSQFGE